MIKRSLMFLFCFMLLSVPAFAADLDAPFNPDIVVIDNGTDLSAVESQLDLIGADIAALSDDLQIVFDNLASPEISGTLDTQPVSFSADTVLGTLDFVLPAGTVSNPFIILPSGAAINGSASTLYLYCPSYPGYTFQASRFAGWQYRTNTTTQNPWYDLNLRNVELSAAPSGSGFLDFGPTVFLAWLALCSIPQLVNSFRRFNS